MGSYAVDRLDEKITGRLFLRGPLTTQELLAGLDIIKSRIPGLLRRLVRQRKIEVHATHEDLMLTTWIIPPPSPPPSGESC